VNDRASVLDNVDFCLSCLFCVIEECLQHRRVSCTGLLLTAEE